LYLLPFLIVAFLWFHGISRMKRRKSARLRDAAETAIAAQTAGQAKRSN
jgi:hypothetical protein